MGCCLPIFAQQPSNDVREPLIPFRNCSVHEDKPSFESSRNNEQSNESLERQVIEPEDDDDDDIKYDDELDFGTSALTLSQQHSLSKNGYCMVHDPLQRDQRTTDTINGYL